MLFGRQTAPPPPRAAFRGSAYSVSEALGREAAVDDSFSEAPFFYASYFAILGLGAALVLIPGAPLLPILFLTQVLNAVLLLLLPLLVAMRALGKDKSLMGDLGNGRVGDALAVTALAIVAASVVGLGVAALL